MSATTPVAQLAWPLSDEPYRYYPNIEAAATPVTTAAGVWGRTMLSWDDCAPQVLAERRAILARSPGRIAALPHTVPAQWDAVEFLWTRAADEFPDLVSVARDEERLHLRHGLTGTDRVVEIGEPAVPVPLTLVAGDLVEDLFLLDDRDGALHLDAVAATFTGAWSPTFALGMRFSDLHGPVPRVHGIGLVDRSERFLRALEPGTVVRRLNWSVHESDALDAALESAADRPAGRTASVARSGRFGDLHLRVELQHLVRLPRTGTLLFTINTQLTSFAEVVTVPAWRRQLVATLTELPEDLAAYKNVGPFRTELVRWLQNHPSPDM